MHPSVHSSTIYIAKMWKQPNCPLADDWIKMYVHSGILLSHRKEWNSAICSNRDGPRDYHAQWSKPDRERRISYDIVYIGVLKKTYNWTCLQNRNRPADLKSTFMVTRRERKGINLEVGINIYIPLYIKYIANKDLLYSTENSKKYFVITCKWKESEKEYTQTHIYLNRCVVHLKLTQHCESAIYCCLVALLCLTLLWPHGL